jgi:hypothetical protein
MIILSVPDAERIVFVDKISHRLPTVAAANIYFSLNIISSSYTSPNIFLAISS